MKFRIITAGPVITKSFDNVEEMRTYVEKHIPMKRGWTGEWEASSTGKIHAYKVFNSKGKRQQGRGAVANHLKQCDDTCTTDCGFCKGQGNREVPVFKIEETPLYFATVQEQQFDPMSAKRLREQRVATFGSEWRLVDRAQIVGGFKK